MRPIMTVLNLNLRSLRSLMIQEVRREG